MFLDWLDITVTTVFDLLWYLVVSPPPLTPPDQAADGPAKATLPSPQPYDDSSPPPPTPQTAADSPLAEKETLPSPQPYDDSSPPPPTSQTATDSPAKETLPSPQPPPQCTTIEQPTPSLFALVIGIDEYADPDLHDLTGAVADADAVKDFLQKTLRVPEHQIKNLRNKDATRVTIEEEIKNLGDNPAIKKGDPILIFYAGHGAVVNAPPGWPTGSADGKIQMLVPHDFISNGSDNSKRGHGVLDVRLSHLLKNIADKKSDNITVIFDCCHSGSGTRDDQTFAVRGIDLPASYTIHNDLHPHVIDSDARADSVPEAFKKAGLLSHVLLSACKAEQFAREVSRESKEGKRGVFTTELLSVLQKHGVDKLTYTDVIANLPDMPAQDPQCEGVHRSRYLFNSKVASPHREIYTINASQSSQPGDRDHGTTLKSAPTPEQYVLEAGEAHGITKNAEFVVFADKIKGSESAWETQSALGTVVAVNTTAFTTTCDFSPRGDKTQRFTLSDPGVALQTRVGDGQDVRLYIELAPELIPVFEQMAKEMKSSEAAKRSFSLVDSREDKPDLVVKLTADRDYLHFEIMDKLCQQHGLKYMPFHNVKIDNPDFIHRILRSSADFYWHLHRSSEGSPLAGKVNLECMKLIETGEYTDDLEEVLMPDPNGANLNIRGVIMVDVDEDATYGFKITNTTPVPLYVSMFYFDMSDLSISSYYQPGHAKKEADVSLPPHGSLTIGYGASGTVPHIYTLRKGQDVDVGFLKLFFSTEYMDLSDVVQNSPFDDVRESGQRKARKKYWWHTMCVPVVQTKGGGTS